MITKLCTIPILLITLLPFTGKTQQVTNTNTNSSTKSTFSYVIQSTYGVTTSANSSPNFKTENEAILKLKAGSFVTNKFGNEAEQATAVFTATPTGANVDLNGISAKNLLLIDDGTYFRSSLKSVDNPDPNYAMQASSSALAIHTSSITIERGESSLTQSFSTSF
jgi:hypothetical protein